MERGEGEGLCPRNANGADSPELDNARPMAEEDDLEAGREFRSGAIAAGVVVFYGSKDRMAG